MTKGFLTHDLVNHSETSSSAGNVSEQMNYFGVCRLPESGSLVRIFYLIKKKKETPGELKMNKERRKTINQSNDLKLEKL